MVVKVLHIRSGTLIVHRSRSSTGRQILNTAPEGKNKMQPLLGCESTHTAVDTYNTLLVLCIVAIASGKCLGSAIQSRPCRSAIKVQMCSRV